MPIAARFFSYPVSQHTFLSASSHSEEITFIVVARKNPKWRRKRGQRELKDKLRNPLELPMSVTPPSSQHPLEYPPNILAAFVSLHCSCLLSLSDADRHTGRETLTTCRIMFPTGGGGLMTRAFLPSRDLMYMEIFFHVLIIFFLATSEPFFSGGMSLLGLL